jgi:hypothetical protein
MQKLFDFANAIEAVQNGRIHIKKTNGLFFLEHRSKTAKYGAGLRLAIERGFLWRHESGNCVNFTAARAEIFAYFLEVALVPISPKKGPSKQWPNDATADNPPANQFEYKKAHCESPDYAKGTILR